MPNPRCVYCDKPLRRFRWHGATWAKPEQQYGDYGDNFFCGLRCGHAWGAMYLKHRGAEYVSTLRANMDKLRKGKS